MNEARTSSTVVLCVNGTRHRLNLDRRTTVSLAERRQVDQHYGDRVEEGVRTLQA
jgi:hypothetical protein